MHSFRITKYNPKFRDNSGAYLIEDEWTEFSDVGKLVTLDQYEKVESAYINSLKLLLNQSGLSNLNIVNLENYQDKYNFSGNSIPCNEFARAFRSVLRSEYWCMFVNGHSYVHFGYDFYSYISIPRVSESDLGLIESWGLFVEKCKSPFLDNDI